MEKTPKGKVAIRHNISIAANDCIEKYQASERMKGNKLTKEEALDKLLLSVKI